MTLAFTAPLRTAESGETGDCASPSIVGESLLLSFLLPTPAVSDPPGRRLQRHVVEVEAVAGRHLLGEGDVVEERVAGQQAGREADLARGDGGEQLVRARRPEHGRLEAGQVTGELAELLGQA